MTQATNTVIADTVASKVVSKVVSKVAGSPSAASELPSQPDLGNGVTAN